MRRAFSLGAVLVLALSTGACATDEETTVASPPSSPAAAGDVSLKLGTVDRTPYGNVVTIPATVTGLRIVAADGDTSGRTGHFHVFIDKQPPAVGQVIPREAGVVHSAENPIKLYGLKVGEHTLRVVLGDGTHKRITEVEETVSVDVKGPSVDATAPATATAGSDVEIEIESEGAEIVAANGDTSGKSGHYHVLVDPASPPQAGAVVPAAVPNKIIHTTEERVTVSGLTKGEHVIWVVLGDGAHKAFDPPVMDRLTVTVS